MCVICIKKQGVSLPTRNLLQAMWNKNPHGAGYMFSRGNYVYIRKGFMSFDEFWYVLRQENFTKNDTVVYHFRISTQAGVGPEMCHPFMLTNELEKTKVLSTRTNVGIAHNGIISLTSNRDPEYSDTAQFIVKYLSRLIEKPSDLADPEMQDAIYNLIHSKMVFLDYAGNVTTVGNFVETKSGLLFSNDYFLPYGYRFQVA